ncbi:MAG: AraC family ligand binding domain-containing protein, partial [Planctomycetota bacterium]
MHDGHELLVIAQGAGTQLTIRGQEPCRSGDIFVFPAHIPHMSYCDRGQSFTCLVLQQAPGDFADTTPGDGGGHLLGILADGARQDNRLPIRPAQSSQVRALMERAVSEWRSPAFGGRCAARALVMEALVILVRDPRIRVPAPRPSDAGDQHVTDAVNWIARYWMQPVRIADLLALGQLGRSQFLAR